MEKIKLITILLFFAFSLNGEIQIKGVTLSENNELLFRLEADSPGYGLYKTLFKMNLNSNQIRQLTFFPEKMEYLEKSGLLQIYNRYGLFRSKINLKSFEPVEGHPSFTEDRQIQYGKSKSISTSSDGKYVIYYDGNSLNSSLVLLDSETGIKTVLVENTTVDYDQIPVKWHPDDRFFIYSHKAKLYYYSITQKKSERILTEDYRYIGDGTIRCVNWNEEGDLYYVKGSWLYLIPRNDLLTRSLYSPDYEPGSPVGKLPDEFDPWQGNFFISPNNEDIVIQEGNTLRVANLKASEYNWSSNESRPWMKVPDNALIHKVSWSSGKKLTIHAGDRIYRLSYNKKSLDQTRETGVKELVLSPEGKRYAVVFRDKISITEDISWTSPLSFDLDSEPVSVCWKDETTLIVGCEDRIYTYNTKTKYSSNLTLSSVEEYGFEGNLIKLSAEGRVFSYVGRDWKKSSGYRIDDFTLNNDNFRVFLDRSFRGILSHKIMVKDLKSKETRELLNQIEFEYESLPFREEEPEGEIFTHGPRSEARNIFLFIDAEEGIEGLGEILRVCEQYNLRINFFLSKSFMNKYQDAVKDISYSGHDVGTLLKISNWGEGKISREIIKRGLAGTEDTYYNITDNELLPLWHISHYFVNSEIAGISKELNYIYVGRDVDTLDWVGKWDGESSHLYMSARELVERAMKLKKPGSVISIRIGKGKFHRDDYLYQHFELLINCLIERGYNITPVTVGTKQEQ